MTSADPAITELRRLLEAGPKGYVRIETGGKEALIDLPALLGRLEAAEAIASRCGEALCLDIEHDRDILAARAARWEAAEAVCEAWDAKVHRKDYATDAEYLRESKRLDTEFGAACAAWRQLREADRG